MSVKHIEVQATQGMVNALSAGDQNAYDHELVRIAIMKALEHAQTIDLDYQRDVEVWAYHARLDKQSRKALEFDTRAAVVKIIPVNGSDRLPEVDVSLLIFNKVRSDYEPFWFHLKQKYIPQISSHN